MNSIKGPKGINGSGENADGMPIGLVSKNKKLLERLEKKKAEAGAAQQAAGAGAAGAKKGGPAPAQPAPAAKVDPKSAAANSNIGPGGREIIVPKGKTRE